MIVARSSYVGRQALAERTKLGEGAARTVLKKLKDQGFIDVVRAGCYLTRSGNSLARSVHAHLDLADTLPISDLTVGRNQAGLVLRGAAAKVKTGIEQRDSAIRIGASGATTYAMKAGRFTVPGGSSDCERDFPSRTWPVIKSELKPRSGDAIVVCGADDEVSARLGALAAALTLL